MPASMIIAETGSKVNEIGSSIATVVTGPMPGSTPTTVPRNTPMKQWRMFCAVRATANPVAILESRSTWLKAGPERQRQPQRVDEYACRERRQRRRQRRHLDRAILTARQRRHHDDRDQRHDEAEPFDQQAEQADRDDDHQQRTQLQGADALVAGSERAGDDDERDQSQHDPERHGKVAGP